MSPRLLNKYRTRIVPEMMERFSLRNKLQVPRLEKIAINMGIGEAAQDLKILEASCDELAAISGQRPIVKRAKRAIASFKIRKGQPVGCMVTLRGKRMYEFLDRLINVALPRIRDFRGLPKESFDQNGNFSVGLSEQVIFPEIDYDKVQRIQGMDIVIVTSTKSKQMATELLRSLGVPFRKD